MDHPASDIQPQHQSAAPPGETLRLEADDIGHLDRVLRGYYLGQIRQIDHRRDRHRARILIENHLVLPKSRQRTSKDAAYIREVLGMEPALLAQLEESRLLRRLNQGGDNPIYEISHDTLVEPILAERHKREAVWGFLRKYGRWFLLLLLLLFAFGMLVENRFDLMDDSLAFRAPSAQDVRLQADTPIIASRGTHPYTLVIPFSDIDAYRTDDSLTLFIDLDVTAHPDLDRQAGPDTIALQLGVLPFTLPEQDLRRLLSTGRDTAIPIRALVPVVTPEGGSGLQATVGGMALLRLNGDPATTPANDPGSFSSANQRTRGMPSSSMADLGSRTIQPGTSTRSVALDTLVNLADFFPQDPLTRSLLEGKSVRLTYRVNVAPAPPAARSVEYVPVSGIEVQFEDGTRRFIPGDPSASSRPASHTVKPGETLYQISKLYGMTTDVLRRLNNLPSNNIQVGQVLKLK